MSNSQAQHQDVSLGDKAASPSGRRFVIVNGDDFGFSHGVNQAIIRAHEQGILTSTSLMVTGEAFDEAVTLAHAHPNLAVGLHVVLGCGKAVLPPSQIPHLVDANGYFSNKSAQAGLYYQFSREAHRELAWEIRAQLEKFCSTGLSLSHVDGHLHMHSQPVVLSIIAGLVEEFQIKAIRLPLEELRFTLSLDRSEWLSKLIWSLVFGGLRRYGEGLLKSKNIAYPQRVYGLLASGRMTEAYLLGLIPQIRVNLVEIYSHPAIVLSGEPTNGPLGLGPAELDALLSDKVRDMLFSHGFELTNYNHLKAITAQ